MANKKSCRYHKNPLGLINKPGQTIESKQTYDRIACVLQGGGALGAYQVGAFRAISEKGYTPNYLSGVSIGAINCAIIAGNPREKQVEKLLEFWHLIMPELWSHQMTKLYNSTMLQHVDSHFSTLYTVLYGLDGFFKPRIIPPISLTNDTPDHLSYYDTSPLKTTLEKLIDFDRINDKKVTLCLGAVNVVTGEMDFFNNHKITITPEHVMASGALPPGFPAIKIGDDYYWDGGIYANTPLVTVLDALPEMDTLCFVIDCFSLKGSMPKDMDEIEERQKDIRYASHSRRLTNVYTSRQNLQAAIEYLGNKLPPEAKQDPEVKKILALGHSKQFSVVHVIYKSPQASHSYKDYDFSPSAIKARIDTGYRDALNVLHKPEWYKKSNKLLACSIYGVTPDFFDQH